MGPLPGKDLSKVPDRCYDPSVQNRSSWDAFVLYPERVRLVEKFFVDRETGRPFYMNQNGAENAALYALQQANPHTRTFQACDMVKMWHLHLEEKTHHKASEAFVGAQPGVPHHGYHHSCQSMRSCSQP